MAFIENRMIDSNAKQSRDETMPGREWIIVEYGVWKRIVFERSVTLDDVRRDHPNASRIRRVPTRQTQGPNVTDNRRGQG
jgi:hypothetical protein